MANPWITEPTICSRPDGSYCAAWMWYGVEDGGDIFCQFYDASGVPMTEVVRVNSTTLSAQYEPNVTLLSDNNILITWESDQDGGAWDFWGIYGQIIDSSGSSIGSEIHLNSTIEGQQIRPKSTSLSNGGFVTVWETYGQDGSGWGIAGRIYDSIGAPIGLDFLANDYKTGDQQSISITRTGINSFCLAWQSTDGNLYLRQFDNLGNAIGSEMVIAPPLVDGKNWVPTITSNVDGDLIVVFNYRPIFETINASDIYLTVISSDGFESVTPFVVNTIVGGYQDNPKVVSLIDGGYAVFWIDNYDTVCFQELASNFQKVGSQKVLFSNPLQMYDVISNPDGGFSIIYTNDTISKVMKFSSTGELLNFTMIGTENSESIEGTSLSDLVYGNGGDDTILTGLGNDLIVSGDGHDKVNAGPGNDLIIGGDGAGNDVYDGGAGIDCVKYTSALSAITVNLSSVTGTATSSSVSDSSNIGNDKLTGIENIISGNYNDTLIGNSWNNDFTGEGGNDIINGGGGNDTAIYEGTKSQYVMTANRNGTWTIQDTEVARDGTDTVTSLEYLKFTDQIFTIPAPKKLAGSSLENTLTGGMSYDTLTGLLGVDTLDGQGGSDLYVMTSSADHTAGEINDTGLSGTDEVRFTARTAGTLILYADDLGIESVVIGSGTAPSAIITSKVANNVNAAAVTNALSIAGNDGNNILTGTSYDDNLTGNAGNDTVYGGDGVDIINGGKGADVLSGGSGMDTFAFTSGDSGKASTSLDKITDFTKGAGGTGDLIDYVSNLTVGGSASTSTSSQASISISTGKASFAVGSGATLYDALSDITARMTASINTKGEFALFQVNNTGDYYVFISDGTAGVGTNDVLIQLMGVTIISAIDIASGNLIITE